MLSNSHQPHSVVLGGAGFVGSHLCDHLIAQGHRVTCIDSLCTGDRENVRHLLPHEDFRLLEHDIRQPLRVDGKVDYVYNLASPASPKHYLDLPILTLETGSIGTQNGLDLALRNGARFLQASTSEVYGDPEVHPQVESYWGRVNPIGPRSVYDEAKRFGEALVMAYRRACGADTVLVRIFNTYGPRMRTDDGRALPTFIWQALHGEELTIHGDGNQTRSFCYIDDLVRGLYAAITSSEAGPINIGNPTEVTIADFAREVLELTGSESGLTFHPRPEDDPTVRKPDISLAQRLLDWSPRIGRREGLERTVAYFRNRLQPKAEAPRKAADRGVVRGRAVPGGAVPSSAGARSSGNVVPRDGNDRVGRGRRADDARGAVGRS